MAKIRSKATTPAATGKRAGGQIKAVRDANTGALVYVVDAQSGTLGQDILNVFRRKVRAARRENVKLLGSPDRVPAGR